jgi:hypothetical protein
MDEWTGSAFDLFQAAGAAQVGNPMVADLSGWPKNLASKSLEETTG